MVRLVRSIRSPIVLSLAAVVVCAPVLGGMCPPQQDITKDALYELREWNNWGPVLPPGVPVEPPANPLSPPGDPGEVGRWLPAQNWAVIAIHSAMLPTGKVLQYAYPSGRSKMWDPATGEFEDAEVDTDLFCSGLSFLADGTLYVTGGNDYACEFQGRFETHIFDPVIGGWLQQEDMADGRWYPTNIELGDGRTVIFTGLGRDCETNPDIEVYTPGVGIELIGQVSLPLYPNMHLLTNGRIAYVGPTPDTYTYDVETNTWQFIDRTNWGGFRGAAPSVLIPGRKDQVMILGGGPDGNVTNTCEIINFRDASPQWRTTAPMHHARKHFDALILPDATVFVCGGGLTGLYENPVNVPELFDPATETWTELPSHQYGRMYHATTVLLPDGRVLVAGQDNGPSAWAGEIYLPRYLFRGERPEIDRSPRAIGYRGTFTVETEQADDIVSVSLIAPTANTHSINMTQRYVELDFERGPGDSLIVDSPPRGNLAPPGYYMLFIRNADDVPSVAAWVQVGNATSADLRNITFTSGAILSGTLDDVRDSDDVYLHTRSGLGTALEELSRMEATIRAVTNVENSSKIDIIIESRLSDPSGRAKISLRNWNTGQFDVIREYAIGVTEGTVSMRRIDAANYVDAQGRIDLNIKHLVLVPFAQPFESFFDQVEILVK